MERLDRVKLIMDFRINDIVVPTNTIGTFRTIVSDNMLIQIGENRIVPLPDTLLVKADLSDLKNINIENIIPRMYHPGNVWSIIKEYSNNKPVYIAGTIIDVQLNLNENFDKIKLKFKDGSIKEYEKRFLENHASYLVNDIPEYIP